MLAIASFIIHYPDDMVPVPANFWSLVASRGSLPTAPAAERR
jgi:hypothetical protein